MAITIKDVAKQAGVSISTVSRVVNDSKPVSPELKKKVMDVIEELGYRPNEVARSLVTKKSYLIGVIVPDIGQSHVANMLRGIEEVGKMYNYDILLCSSYGDKNAELSYLQLLNRKQVEGLIILSAKLEKDVENSIKAFNIPFVFLSTNDNREEYRSVDIDNQIAVMEMVNYLQQLGHEDIAYLGIKPGKKTKAFVKRSAFVKAMKDSGLSGEATYETESLGIEPGYEAAKEIMGAKPRPTAVFCASDELAIGVMNYCHDQGISVPDDLSIAGMGDIEMASHIRPRLTTISIPYYDIGAVAIRRIVKALKEEELTEAEIKLPFQIHRRESSKNRA
jgi:LacI family transcriptional regulator